MSIQTELTRIINAKAAIKTAVEGKGVDVPSGAKLDGMAALIESIQAGGGGGAKITTGKFTVSDDISSPIEITHNLGIKPYFIGVFSSNDKIGGYTSTSPTGLVFAYLIKSSIKFYMKYQVGSSKAAYNDGPISSSDTGTSGGWYRFNLTDSVFTLKQSNISSSYGLGAGNSFWWIAVAEEIE